MTPRHEHDWMLEGKPILFGVSTNVQAYLLYECVYCKMQRMDTHEYDDGVVGRMLIEMHAFIDREKAWPPASHYWKNA